TTASGVDEVAQTQKLVDGIFTQARVAMNRRAQASVDNLRRFLMALPKVQTDEAYALLIGMCMLMAGTALVATPVFAIAYAFHTGESDPLSCTRLDGKRLVVAQFAALGVLLAGGWFIWRRLGKSHGFRACLGLSLLLGAVITVLWWKLAPPNPSEAAGGFYPHIYICFVAALLVVALIARPLAHAAFYSFPQKECFRAAMTSEDLLSDRRDPPDISGLRLLSALINGATSHLLHFLLLPSFVAFIAPSNLLWPLTFIFTGVGWVLLLYGSLSTRWAQMLVHVQRWFLVGAPLVMSILVITLAILRLAGVQYVATVLDATPVGVLFIFIVMMYVAFWFFEYWVNRWIGEELLELLCDKPKCDEGFTPCAYVPGKEDKPWAKVQGRYIALHGLGRFAALGWFERKDPAPGERKREFAFTTYSFNELFVALGRRQKNGEEIARDVRRRVHLYFTFLNGFLIVAAVGLFLWHRDWSRPLAVEPMVDARVATDDMVSNAAVQAAAPAPVDPLGERLLAQAGAGRPSLVVAASGGGTRAALYTAVALEGIGQIDRARDVVLLSGVSGGGVSAAIFASRFAELSASDPRQETVENPGPWWKYISTASQPYIQDVLEGIGELRISGSASLGVLLKESLDRRAFAQEMTSIRTFGALADPALILNTAISGHPYNDSELLKGRIAAPGQSCVAQSRPYANLAGGRLIFTNLRNLTGFPQADLTIPDMWLPYRVVNDGTVELAAASALTANFPPVFSNARVRLVVRPDEKCGAQSYFVTDGGATENLGLVSALYALRGTLQQLPPGAPISDIHVLALEASAIDYDYRDDRGVGAATGGSKERINAGLTQSL
ncbi:MAG: hypothetical protein ACYC0F_20475, partial [Rhodanobacter sp.]